jgi:hypothetical protein
LHFEGVEKIDIGSGARTLLSSHVISLNCHPDLSSLATSYLKAV